MAGENKSSSLGRSAQLHRGKRNKMHYAFTNTETMSKTQTELPGRWHMKLINLLPNLTRIRLIRFCLFGWFLRWGLVYLS